MNYHRDVLAKEILLAIISTKVDLVTPFLVEISFEIADAMIARSLKPAPDAR